jgi:membrane-bound ClpP family serine protease
VTKRYGPLSTYLGLAAVGLGLALIVLGWGLVAAETDVRDQLAPLVAAGLGGLALVIVGVVAVQASTSRRDEEEHLRQLASLADVLADVRQELGGTSR